MSDERSRELDRAIDAAVQDYMDVDASRAFRRTVLRRLQRPAGGAAWWRAVAAAGAFAAVLLAGLLLMQPGDGSPEREPTAPTPRPSRTTAGVDDGKDPLAGIDANQPDPRVPPRVARRDTPGRQMPAPGRSAPPARAAMAVVPALPASPMPPGPAAVETQPLSPVESIVPPAIDMATVAPEEIVIPPLAPMAALHIEALPPLGGGDGER